MSLNFLRMNLHEIHSASNTDGGQLVSNLKGTRIYHTSVGWGRLWVWFYTVTNPFSKKDLRKERLRKCMINIGVTFEREHQNLKEQVEKYNDYLRFRLASTKVEEKNYHQARREIKEWKLLTPFLKPDSLTKQKPLCQKYLDKGDSLPGFLLEKQTDISSLHRIIKLEGEEQGPLPLDLVNKLATGIAMEKGDFNKLMEWILKFKKIRTLHKFLVSLSKFMKNPDIAQFELTCLQNKCDVFKKSDPKHLQWRQTLKKGVKVDNMVLGEQMKIKPSGFDEQIFFEIKDQPDKLMMVSTNEAVLDLKNAWTKEGSWGLKTATFHEIDPHGRYAIVEKFIAAYSNAEWTSKTTLSDRDQRFATPLANYIKWMIDEKITVTQLNPGYIMLDNQARLRSVKIQERMNFDYCALEKFVLDCSDKNIFVFRFLMTESGLENTNHALFYKKVIEEVLDNKKPDISMIGAVREIGDRRDIERATELCKDILSLRDKLVVELKLDRDVVATCLKEQYLITRAGYILWPTLEQQTRNALKNVLQAHPTNVTTKK